MAVVTSVPHLAKLGSLPDEWIAEYMLLANNILRDASEYYYREDASLITDADYDRMMRELTALVEEFPELAPIDNVTTTVGH